MIQSDFGMLYVSEPRVGAGESGRTTVARRNVEKIMAVKRELLRMPQALAPQLQGLQRREIEAILDIRMREMLKRFSEM